VPKEEEEIVIGWNLDTFKKSWMPGLTVALVSVPLSTALSIASGCTPSMGISTAVFGPALQGILGGSNYNILGPAGALVNINHKL
jgi:SulP family sulfate permease